MISARPFWLETVAEADFRVAGRHSDPELPSHANVAIVGGGIIGLACAHYLAAAVRAMEPALNPDRVFGAAWYPEDSHVNPAKLGAAFARQAQRGGARLVTGTPVRSIEAIPAGARLHTDRGALEAAHVVVTAGA